MNLVYCEGAESGFLIEQIHIDALRQRHCHRVVESSSCA